MNLTTKKYITSITMIGSVILMIILSKPWTVNRTNPDLIRSYILGISGLVGMVIMTWQVILGIRPARGRWIKDLFWVNGIHKWLGIGTLMAIILHPIAAVVSYGTSWTYAILFDFSSSFEGRVSLGKIAFDLIIVVLVTSILSRKILAFRTRHWVHLLSYPAFIAVWFHAWFTGGTIATVPAVRYYWIFIGVMLAIATIARIAYQFGYLKIKATLISHIQQTNNVYEISFQLPHHIDYIPGQFVYLQTKRGGESHPFTVLSYDDQTNILKIAYKTLGQFTQSLAKRISTQSDKPMIMYLDGPYGSFMQDHLVDAPVVCIAGGIGVTPFFQLTQQQHDQDITLIYLNQTHDTAAYTRDLNQALGDKCIHVLSRTTNKTAANEVVGSRLTADILRQQIGDKLASAQFYLCGGGSVITSTREMLLALGVSSERIEREPFSI